MEKYLVGVFDFWRQWLSCGAFLYLHPSIFPSSPLPFFFVVLRSEQFTLKYHSNTSLPQSLLKKKIKKEKRKKKVEGGGAAFQ